MLYQSQSQCTYAVLWVVRIRNYHKTQLDYLVCFQTMEKNNWKFWQIFKKTFRLQKILRNCLGIHQKPLVCSLDQPNWKQQNQVVGKLHPHRICVLVLNIAFHNYLCHRSFAELSNKFHFGWYLHQVQCQIRKHSKFQILQRNFPIVSRFCLYTELRCNRFQCEALFLKYMWFGFRP